jgi:hypothetical protein
MATTTTTPDPNANRVAPFADLNSAKIQATTPAPVFRFRQSIFANPSVETTTIAVFNKPIVTSTTTTTTTTLAPAITLANANVIGHQLGSIKLPTKGSGGVPNSFSNTKGSVELLSIGVDKEVIGPLTFEVYDFFTERLNSDPVRVVTGETSVTNWDSDKQTGVISINTTIECKADPTANDGSMDLQVVIRDSNLNTLYHFINVEQPAQNITTTQQPTLNGDNLLNTVFPWLDGSADAEDANESSKDELDKIIPDNSRVIIRGPEVPVGDNEEVIIVDQKDISIDINSEDNLSVTKETLDILLDDNAVVVVKPTITTTTTTKQPDDFDGQSTYTKTETTEEETKDTTYVVVVEPKSPIPVTPPPTTTTPKLTNPFVNPNIPTTTTLPVDDTPIIMVDTFEDMFGTTLSVTTQPPPPLVTTQEPFTRLVYTTRPPVTVPPTTTTTTTTKAPLGDTDSTIFEINARQPDPVDVSKDPKISLPVDSSTTRQPVVTTPLPGMVTTPSLNDSIKEIFSSTVDDETQSEVDNLVEISKTSTVDLAKIITTPPAADGSTTRQPVVTPSPPVSDFREALLRQLRILEAISNPSPLDLARIAAARSQLGLTIDPVVTTTQSPGEGTTFDIDARQPDPVVTTTTTTLPVAVITTPPPPQLPPNTVTNQEELIEAINTYSEVLITRKLYC